MSLVNTVWKGQDGFLRRVVRFDPLSSTSVYYQIKRGDTFEKSLGKYDYAIGYNSYYYRERFKQFVGWYTDDKLIILEILKI